MKITIFGAGYVGLVTGVCFAELGNDVFCVDVDQNKVDRLQSGEPLIYEPDLAEMLTRNLAQGRINFTTDVAQAAKHGVVQFIGVGTPSADNGAADLSYVLAVAKSIGQHITDYCVIVNKSTVPVGTSQKVREEINKALQQRKLQITFDVVSNPEFLREGAAIKDFMNPDRVIVGANRDEPIAIMKQLYAPLITDPQRFIVMDTSSAELSKYAANAFLATKISFINEMSRIAERAGADIEAIRLGMTTDHRIGPHFLFAGCGYGGSCFPKDVRALQHSAEQLGLQPHILNAVEKVNQEQKQILAHKIQHYFANQLTNKVIAIWGLAFKPNTNDMREASSRNLMEALWLHGAKIQAYDPVANHEANMIYGERADLQLCDDPIAALEKADALAILTEWPQFREADLALIKSKLRHPVIFDGRNLFEPANVAAAGLTYYGIGRQSIDI